MSFCLAYCEDLEEIRFWSASLQCVSKPTLTLKRYHRQLQHALSALFHSIRNRFR
jgi:hypothetical protein